MSLLDDVSIVVTPNGYKAGTLFAVKPTIAYGSELVVNGDFSQGNTGWTIEAVWTISGGAAHGNGASGSSQELKQAILEVGKTYEFSYEIRNRVSGSVELLNSGLGSTSSNEVYKSIGIATSTELRFRPSSFNGDIYNVSVREFTGADMDVTRATAGTRVDEDGLVNYAEVIGDELVTNGDFATDSDWSVTQSGNDTITIENGYALFNCPDNSNIYISQGGLLTIGKTYIASVDLLSIDSGSLQFAQGGGGTITGSPSINTLGTHTFTFIAATATFAVKRKLGAPNLLNAKIDNVSVKEVTRDNVPRIDYTGGGCPHILSEPQRTNLLTYSSDFSQSYWTKQSNITPTYNTTETLSPDGTYNATKLVGNGTDGIYKASISITGVAARSVYLKSVTGTVNVILKDPNLTVTSPTLDVTTEWQRFELTADNGSGGQGIWVDDIPASGIYIWGAQVEESYPTSYIPTSGGTVTRNQDQFTRDGIGSLINSPEGVLFVEMAALSDDGTLRCITLSDGGITNRVLIIYNTQSNSIRAVVVSNAGTSFDELHTVTSTLDFHKIAIKWKLNDFAFWIDGVEVATDTSGAAPIGLDRIVFDVGNGTYDFYGKVKQLQVYNTALTDEQLLQLTGTSGTDFYESYAEMASALTYTIQ